MITEKRFNELFDKNATIYWVHQRDQMIWCDAIQARDYLFPCFGSKCVFENEEDANWVVTTTKARIDYLEFPLYKDFIKSAHKVISFYGKAPHCYYSLYVAENRIKLFDNDCQNFVCDYELTFENYKKVCEKAGRLFMYSEAELLEDIDDE